jgi:5'-deoxynucleotidase YfbR-like HD superfamily hydrolase
LKTRLEFLTLGAEVKRFHTVTTLRGETVGHHSHGVAMLCLMLDPDASASLLKAALLHDLAEQATGDIPSPAKRELGIRDQISAVEQAVLLNADFRLPDLTTHEARTLKLADIAHGALFCVREMELGNRRARQVFDRYMSYASGLRCGAESELFNTIAEMAK